MSLALAKSVAQILVPVMREQRIPAWPRPNDERVPKVDYQPLEFALLTEHATDAHMTAYSVPLQPYRLNKSAPEVLKGGVRMVLAVFDIDGPNHAATDEWWGDQGENLARLNEAMPNLYVYRTRGGYRLVGRLAQALVIKTADDSKAWTDTYLQWCAWLWRCFQIKADPVGDWQRLYRLPVVKRDGKTVRHATLGDAGNVGAWVCKPTSEDVESAKALRRKPTSDKPKGTAKVRTATSNYTGSGVIVRALQNRGDLGSEIQPGMWAIRCPRANEHSSGSDFDTSTVVFAPNSAGDQLGWIDCKHTNCGHFDKSLKDWLRCFDQSELDRAREQLGIPVQKPHPKADNDHAEYSDADAQNAPPAFTVHGTSAPMVAAAPLLKILGPAEIFAELPPLEYLVEQLVVRGTATQILAYGSSGKSWVAMHMAVAAAAGVAFLGRFTTKQCRVLYLDFENGTREAMRRIQANSRALGIATADLPLGLCSMPGIYLDDPRFIGEIERLANAFDLFVVDTLKAATRGEENSSDARKPIDAIKAIIDQTQGALVVLSHCKKTSQSVTKIDPRETGRGSSAIFDSFDSVLHLAYEEGEPLLATQTKCRAGRLVDAFGVTITDTENGGVAVTACDTPEKAVENQSAKFMAKCDQVVAVLKTEPGATGNKLREALKCSGDTLTKVTTFLVRNGVIEDRSTRRDVPVWHYRGTAGQ